MPFHHKAKRGIGRLGRSAGWGARIGGLATRRGAGIGAATLASYGLKGRQATLQALAARNQRIARKEQSRLPALAASLKTAERALATASRRRNETAQQANSPAGRADARRKADALNQARRQQAAAAASAKTAQQVLSRAQETTSKSGLTAARNGAQRAKAALRTANRQLKTAETAYTRTAVARLEALIREEQRKVKTRDDLALRIARTEGKIERLGARSDDALSRADDLVTRITDSKGRIRSRRAVASADIANLKTRASDALAAYDTETARLAKEREYQASHPQLTTPLPVEYEPAIVLPNPVTSTGDMDGADAPQSLIQRPGGPIVMYHGTPRFYSGVPKVPTAAQSKDVLQTGTLSLSSNLEAPLLFAGEGPDARLYSVEIPRLEVKDLTHVNTRALAREIEKARNEGWTAVAIPDITTGGDQPEFRLLRDVDESAWKVGPTVGRVDEADADISDIIRRFQQGEALSATDRRRAAQHALEMVRHDRMNIDIADNIAEEGFMSAADRVALGEREAANLELLQGLRSQAARIHIKATPPQYNELYFPRDTDAETGTTVIHVKGGHPQETAGVVADITLASALPDNPTPLESIVAPLVMPPPTSPGNAVQRQPHQRQPRPSYGPPPKPPKAKGGRHPFLSRRETR